MAPPSDFYMSLLCIFAAIAATLSDETIKSSTLVAPPTSCTRHAKNDDMVYVHYIGTLGDGKEFDNTHKHHPPQPYGFKMGSGYVIKGLEQGIVGMCVGEKRRVTVPASLGFGDEGFEKHVPPKSTLIFEVELIDIKDDDGSYEKHMATQSEEEHRHATPFEFEHMDENKDHHITREELIKFIQKEVKDAGENATVKDIEKTADHVIKEHDHDGDGKISFEENQHFGEGHGEEHDEEMDEDHDGTQYLDHTFEKIDKDKDKFITREEMRAHLVAHTDEGHRENIDEEVKKIFAHHDFDKDGKISVEEIENEKTHGGDL